MKLTIDNLDGAGTVDYSRTVCPEGPLTIERVLNMPSRCHALLEVSDAGLAVPLRRGRVVVARADGALLFTGYIATEPALVYAGRGTKGAVYRVAFSAVSDEWLLDKQPAPASGPGYAQLAGAALKTMTQRLDAVAFSTTGVTNGRVAGLFATVQTAGWAANAGRLAGSTYAAYRVVNGAIQLQLAGSVTHTLSDGEATLRFTSLKTAQVKELANDVTLSGAMEPSTYVTEVFAGDGVTSTFQLTEVPHRVRGAAASRWVSDSFDAGSLNPQVWSVSDPGSHLGLSGAGLTMSGGNGLDGQTTLTAIDALEVGGTLVVEAGSVRMDASSTGMLCGLYAGMTQQANCLAGYSVRQSGGATVVRPMVQGVETGAAYTMLSGHRYTLRIRLHCPEMQRVRQTYYAMVDGAVQSFGGGMAEAPVALVFELQDLGASSNTPATVLYDGVVTRSPASCSFVAANSIQLFGTMGYCRVTQTGSAWVTCTLPDGTKATRLVGIAGEGVDCVLSVTGLVTFLAGRVPVAGELVTVTYRRSRRSVARLEDAASVAAEAAGGGPGSARWMGRVVHPVTRSSADCECAAQAVLAFATSRAAAIAGRCEAINGDDVWPGDVLNFMRNGQMVQVMVRRVTIEDGHAWPEWLTYRIDFANDWAEGLGLELSESIATDALLPQTAAALPGNVLANLQQLQVVSATETALQVDAGVAPPAGGGFEVRRRDGDFGPGVDQDLVLRSPVRSFAIPREGQVERYFVRMYDGSPTPIYTRFSNAIFTHLPVS